MWTENETAANCERQLATDLTTLRIPSEILRLMVQCLSDDPLQRPRADELLATISRVFLTECAKNPEIECPLLGDDFGYTNAHTKRQKADTLRSDSHAVCVY